MDNIMTDWQIEKSVANINTNISKAASIGSMLDKIRIVLNHEQKVSSKGEETQFRRNNVKSEEIGRKYRILKMLQSEEIKLRGSKNASLVTRTQKNELCKNLTAEFAAPMCLQSNCIPSAPYRSIDGCCNNLESPTQGIFMQTNPPNYLIVPLAGMADSAFLRLLPPDYFDQVSLPRGGLTSSLLPNARAVSVAVHQAHEETKHRNKSISQMVMQFGQGGNL